MSDYIILSATEIAQLAALGPCLFLLGFLIFSTRQFSLTFLPIIYFISLTCSFLLPILSVFPEFDSKTLRAILLFNEHLAPEIAFLLILQFILRKPPPLIFFSILAIPIVGSALFLFLAIEGRDVCLSDTTCISAENILALYRIIGSSVVFLLLFIFIPQMPKIGKEDVTRKHKYWLIIAMIAYSLLVVMVDLIKIVDMVSLERAIFIKTMIGVTFVYLVPTSIFRVFNKNLKIRPITSSKVENRDKKLAGKVRNILETERPYRDLEFNRGVMADKMGLTEQHLSRVVNTHFGKSFTDTVNELRVRDAKQMLQKTDKKITDISFNIGFSSIASFNRVFKESTGMTPRDYRNSANGDNIGELPTATSGG